MVFGIAILILFSWGVFDPVIERTQILAMEGAVDAGRGDLEESAIKIYQSSNGLGIGNGKTQVDKCLYHIDDQKYHVGVHNYYIYTLVENGILGLFFVVIYFFFLSLKFDYRHSLSYYALMLFLLSFNTEPIYSQAEFMSPAFFVFMICLKRNIRNESVVHMLS